MKVNYSKHFKALGTDCKFVVSLCAGCAVL